MSEKILVDGHVHLYAGADRGHFLAAALNNMAAAAQGRGLARWSACLLFAETARDDAFDALRNARTLPEGWRLQPLPDDPAAITFRRTKDDAALTVIAGRQIITEEGLEVLALATARRFDDGQPARTVLGQLRAAAIPAVLPWGVGKWLGRRGRLVDALLAEMGGPGLLLGDNAGRPPGWPRPRLFAAGAACGVRVLPGTDPLPLAGAETGVGRFGFMLEGGLDPDRPARDIAQRLTGLNTQPEIFGRRRSLVAVLREQIALRRNRPPTGGPTA